MNLSKLAVLSWFCGVLLVVNDFFRTLLIFLRLFAPGYVLLLTIRNKKSAEV